AAVLQCVVWRGSIRRSSRGSDRPTTAGRFYAVFNTSAKIHRHSDAAPCASAVAGHCECPMSLGATTSAPPARLHYAWIAAGVTFLTLLAAAGARATPGVIILPIGNEFQWSRGTVSSIVSVNIFLYGLMGPFAAALYQRFGLRRTMVAAMLLLTTGYGLSTIATHYWQFVVLWGVVVGLGSGMAATVLGAAVANRWFTARRGLVMGVLTASTATGQLVFLRALAGAATTNWRWAIAITAGATALVVPVIAWLMRDDPRDVGLRPYGESGAPDPKPAATSNV